MPDVSNQPVPPPVIAHVELTIEFDREEDGRWIAEVPKLPGVLVYGNSQGEALAKAEALALRVLAEQLEQEAAQQATANPELRATPST